MFRRRRVARSFAITAAVLLGMHSVLHAFAQHDSAKGLTEHRASSGSNVAATTCGEALAQTLALAKKQVPQRPPTKQDRLLAGFERLEKQQKRLLTETIPTLTVDEFHALILKLSGGDASWCP
jgi:hypothetical protein